MDWYEFARLCGDVDVERRTQALRMFVEEWHGPTSATDGYSEDELPEDLPNILRNWYVWAGHRKVLSGQNHLLMPERLNPERLELEDDKLVFYAENQWVYRWSSDPNGIDPPVYTRECYVTEPWQDEGHTVSQHLLCAALFEAVIAAPFQAFQAQAGIDDVDRITSHMTHLELPPWWRGTVQFYIRNGVVLYTMENPTGGNRLDDLGIGAAAVEALDFAKPLMNEKWDYFGL